MNIKIDKHPKDRRKVLPRVFVWGADESVLENMANRRHRPYSVWRKEILPEVWERLGLTNVKVRWSQYAGCTCPCSPGFIVTSGYGGQDLHVSVTPPLND